MIPSLRGWHQQYADQGLVVIGNHYPEFTFEHDINAVKDAIVRLDVPYPVLQDNGRETWNAYNNRFWPALYLIDKQGRLRYRHFGEGRYEQTEQAIVDLLREDYDAAVQPVRAAAARFDADRTYSSCAAGQALRTGPSACIAPGEVYRHHGKQDGWYRIRYQGREGYVSEDYVALSRRLNPAPTRTSTTPTAPSAPVAAGIIRRPSGLSPLALVALLRHSAL